ncbi:MAG: GYD domain-containing protein [Acidimicrobiia bacterium]
MPTYVMLSTLGPGGWATLRENPDRLREVSDEVESMGLKVVAQYALMGQWDFLNIIEAPDEAAMAKAAVSLAARGTMRTTTLQALPIEMLIETLRST